MIKNVTLKNVVGFAEYSNVVPFPGITVILGKNDACKTALLKMMYAVGKATEQYSKQAEHHSSVSFREILSEKVKDVYGSMRNGLGDLVRKNGAPQKLSVSMAFEKGWAVDVKFSFGTDARKMIADFEVNQSGQKQTSNYVFIPAKEVVTAFNAIKAIARQYYFPGYDDTTLDLIDLLDIPVKQTDTIGGMAEVLQKMKEMFAGELEQVDSNERFVFRRGSTDYQMPVTAEGVKHIGILPTLIRNGQIKEGTVLFLDEPEDNLHPQALRQLVKVLGLLSRTGVQIFVTTHNYFTLKQMQIESRKYKMDVMCCSLKRNEENVVVSSFANLRENMPDNDIVEESLVMYDEDIEVELA